MKKFECLGCNRHHVIESAEKPVFCIMTVERPNWREVPADQTAEEKFPSWCKVGAWVWISRDSNIGYNEYHRIKKIEGDGMIHFCRGLVTGICNAGKMFYEARLRPWTPEEAIHFLGCEFTIYDELLKICAVGNGYIVDNKDRSIPFCELAKEAILDELSPCCCGVREHREGEGWVR